MDQANDRTPSIWLVDELKRVAPLELAGLAPDRPDLFGKYGTNLNGNERGPGPLDLLASLLDSETPQRVSEVGSGGGAVMTCLPGDEHPVVTIEVRLPADTGATRREARPVLLLQRTVDAPYAPRT